MISIFIRFIALILAFCFFQKKLNEKRFRFLFIYSDAIVCALIIFSLCVLLAGKIPTNILDFHIISPSIVLILINLLCYLALHIGSKYIKPIFSTKEGYVSDGKTVLTKKGTLQVKLASVLGKKNYLQEM